MKRRNKWICALKTSLAELKIYGPTGDPDAKSAMKVYAEMPWEEYKFNDRTEMPLPQHSMETTIPRGDYAFADKNAELRKSLVYFQTQTIVECLVYVSL